MAAQLRALHAQVWALSEPHSLRMVFDGVALLYPLRHGRAPADPSERILENAALLYAVAAKTGHPTALTAAVEEARSLLYFSLSDAGANLFWHLPFVSHTALLSGVLVPAALAVCRMDPTPHLELDVVVRALLSAADTEVEAPYVVPEGLSFATVDERPFPPFQASEGDLAALSSSQPSEDLGTAQPVATGASSRVRRSFFGSRATKIQIADPHGPAGSSAAAGRSDAPRTTAESKFGELAAKMQALVCQFCRGTSKPTALVVLGLLPTTVRSTAALVKLMEAALQAFLLNSGLEADGVAELDFVSEPLSVLGAAMISNPDLSIGVAVSDCMAQQVTAHPSLETRCPTTHFRFAWKALSLPRSHGMQEELLETWCSCPAGAPDTAPSTHAAHRHARCRFAHGLDARCQYASRFETAWYSHLTHLASA